MDRDLIIALLAGEEKLTTERLGKEGSRTKRKPERVQAGQGRGDNFKDNSNESEDKESRRMEWQCFPGVATFGSRGRKGHGLCCGEAKARKRAGRAGQGRTFLKRTRTKEKIRKAGGWSGNGSQE